MNRVLGELLRRNVLRVAAAYLVVGWLIMQVVSKAFRPDWWRGAPFHHQNGQSAGLLARTWPSTAMPAYGRERFPG